MAICTTGPAPAPAPEFTNRGIADHIRTRIIHEGLELEEIGIELAQITDDVPLFDDDGLNLDSIDALEILAGVQREYGLSFPDVDQAFMVEHCSTVARLARLVESMSADRAGGGRAADTDALPRASGVGREGRAANAGAEESPDGPAAQSPSLRGERDA